MAKDWDDIPSIEDLKIDWDYEPDDQFGKRSEKRLTEKQLLRLIDQDSVPVRILPVVPVKIMSHKAHDKGYLIDISSDGLAVLFEIEMKVETMVKVGFFLGKHKIISKGIIKNVSVLAGYYRLGVKFVDLNEETVSFIKSLNSSAAYKP